MRKHLISLYGLVIIILIIQSITIATLFFTTQDLSQNINQSYDELRTDQEDISGKINEISESLMESHSSISNQLQEIKLKTSEDFSEIIEDIVPSVMTIITEKSQGTGFIINEQGFLVTNSHVISNANNLKVINSEREILNGNLVGFNSSLDLALIKVSGNYPSLQLEKEVKVGEKVIAIGNPLGLSFSVTEGIVSAMDRKGPNQIPAYIQTDVALNPGNSGGPLINSQGKVVGINNFKLGGAEGIGFALESEYIKKTINLISQQKIGDKII